MDCLKDANSGRDFNVDVDKMYARDKEMVKNNREWMRFTSIKNLPALAGQSQTG